MAKQHHNTQTPDQLRALLADERGKMSSLQQELVGKKLSDTSQIRQVRKEIARILTALQQAK